MIMEGPASIIMYGADWCGASRRVRLFLDSHSIVYTLIDIDLDREAARQVEAINHGNRSVPTIVWPDGTFLVEPSNAQLAEKLGIKA
jgi:glutaredoxin